MRLSRVSESALFNEEDLIHSSPDFPQWSTVNEAFVFVAHRGIKSNRYQRLNDARLRIVARVAGSVPFRNALIE